MMIEVFMVIKKSEAVPIKVGKHHFVLDYPMGSKDIGISIQKINGTTPERGWWKNKVCLECYYVLSGKGTVSIEEKTYSIHAGDAIVLKQGCRHKLIGENLKAVAVTVPDWYEQQAEIIEK